MLSRRHRQLFCLALLQLCHYAHTQQYPYNPQQYFNENLQQHYQQMMAEHQIRNARLAQTLNLGAQHMNMPPLLSGVRPVSMQGLPSMSAPLLPVAHLNHLNNINSMLHSHIPMPSGQLPMPSGVAPMGQLFQAPLMLPETSMGGASPPASDGGELVEIGHKEEEEDVAAPPASAIPPTTTLLPATQAPKKISGDAGESSSASTENASGEQMEQVEQLEDQLAEGSSAPSSPAPTTRRSIAHSTPAIKITTTPPHSTVRFSQEKKEITTMHPLPSKTDDGDLLFDSSSIHVPFPKETSFAPLDTSVTGAPLDLEREATHVSDAEYHQRHRHRENEPLRERMHHSWQNDRPTISTHVKTTPTETTPSEAPPTTTAASRTVIEDLPQQPVVVKTMTPVPHTNKHHFGTNFERLATDYQERLLGTDDLNQVIGNIYKNAYISLQRNDPKQKPRKHAQIRKSIYSQL